MRPHIKPLIPIIIMGGLVFPLNQHIATQVIPGSAELVAVVIAFSYLIILPGYLLSSLVAPPELPNPYVRFASIVGFGIGFSEITGLLAYYIGYLIHANFNLLYLSLNAALLSILVILNWKHDGTKAENTAIIFQEKRKWVKNALISLLIFTMGLSGAYLVAAKNAYYLLLLDYFIIIVILLTKGKIRFLSDLSHHLLIWTIALTLLYSTTLAISWRNLQGWDIFGEFYVAKHVYMHESIRITFKDYVLNTYVSTLSISLLPFIFKSVGRVSITILFKFVYPLTFSLTAPLLYSIYHNLSKSKRMALLATGLNVLFYQYFLFNLQLARLMIGAFYYVLFMHSFITPHERKTRILAFLWAILTILNYYTIGYLLMMQLIFLVVWNYIIPIIQRTPSQLKDSTRYLQKVALIITGAFILWYGYLTGGAALDRIVAKIKKFLDPITPGSSPPSTSSTTNTGTYIPPNNPAKTQTHLTTTWIYSIRNIILISALGFSAIGLLLNLLPLKKRNSHKLNHPMFLGMGVFWIGISAMTYLFPTIALALNAPRVYSLSMFVLAIYSIWTVYFISNTILSKILRNQDKAKFITEVIMILYLFIYFVSSTGISTIITDNHSFPPPVQFSNKIDWPRGTIEEMSVGMWMEMYQNSNFTIYADEFRIKFMPYTGNRKMIGKGTLPTRAMNSSCGYLFLGKYNTEHHKLLIYVPKLKKRYYLQISPSILIKANVIHSTDSTEMLYWR